MSKMIPTVISPEVKSNAERKVFEWFRDDPETNGWYVLHSLGISNHSTRIEGEIDFLVIAPQLGAFALEVKGGRVKREDGVWMFTDRYGKTSLKSRGPYEQANEGIHSLFSMIKNKNGNESLVSNVLYGWGIMFPDIEFEISDPAIERWQIFDKRNGNHVGEFIKRLAANVKNKWIETYGGNSIGNKLPDTKTVRELVNSLRGDFDKAVPFSTRVSFSETELIRLTNDQLRCLDQLEDNPRCMVLGPAGTGKTLLAIEQCKRNAAAGEKIAFFCFNSLLANWLSDSFSALDKQLQPQFVGTFHSFLLSQIQKAGIISKNDIEFDSDFFKQELPYYALEAIEKNNCQFDRIIIDEAQDLLNAENIEIFDLILKKGFSRGKWYFFGDFSNQAIYTEASFGKVRNMIEEKTSFIIFKLWTNCRNTRNIGEQTKIITGLDNPHYLDNTKDGVPVDYLTYTDINDEAVKLTHLITELLEKKINPSNITIISPVRRESSVISMTSVKVADYALNVKGISFSTIQAYKGLENSIIIITDVTSIKDERLMYVGLSRARSALYVLLTKQAESEKSQKIMRTL